MPFFDGHSDLEKKRDHMAKKKDEELEKAVEKLDKEIEKSKNSDESEDIIICPKCKRPVTEGDYLDQFTNPMDDSMITKIECPQCGYVGLPVEMGMKEFQKMVKGSPKE
jgi:DNA-directed RNA polymerase subunit M/transcription elongation factor TFIIS